MKKFLFIFGLLIIISLPVLADGSDTEVVLRPVCTTGAQSLDSCVQSSETSDQAVGSFAQGQEFDIAVVIKNPTQQNIISARTWLTYDSTQLEGVALQTTDSPFTLVAPGEDGFDASTGQVKIGRSNISGGVKTPEIKVATVRFKVKAAQATGSIISFYDYQVSELGHTSINIIDGGFPVNLLSKAPKNLQLSLNGGGPSSSGSTSTVPTPYSGLTPAPVNVGSGSNIGGPGDLVPMANLNRPARLKVGTGEGYALLKWDLSKERDLKGYNLYYGRTSGSYTRRHDVKKNSSYRLEGLNKGETYYFALTAYDKNAHESDYSNEVAVIIGEPLSSTAPIGNMLGRVPNQPQNGPLMGWVLFSAAGLSASVLFRRKKQIT